MEEIPTSNQKLSPVEKAFDDGRRIGKVELIFDLLASALIIGMILFIANGF